MKDAAYFHALNEAMAEAEDEGLDPYSEAVAEAALNRRNERMADWADELRSRQKDAM